MDNFIEYIDDIFPVIGNTMTLYIFEGKYYIWSDDLGRYYEVNPEPYIFGKDYKR